MIRVDDNCFVIQPGDQLPDLTNARRLYVDVETQSFDRNRPGNYPFQNDRIAGVGLSRDDDPRIFYAPVRHTSARWNIDQEAYQRWLKATVETAYEFVAFNGKFDAHFCAADGAEFQRRLVDVLTLAKCYETDRLNYSMKPLCRAWMGVKTDEADAVSLWMNEAKTKNHADVPADIEGKYCCGDVRMMRNLLLHMEKTRPGGLEWVWENEILFTAVLYDMEKDGIRADPLHLKKEAYITTHKLMKLHQELSDLTDREFVDSNAFIHDFLIVQQGLPILAWTIDKKTGRRKNASFNKKAFPLYETHPLVHMNKKALRFIQLLSKYRSESNYLSLFLNPYLQFLDKGNKVHPDYNQVVRTGRMSCRRPNLQQVNERAKGLILPDEDEELVEYDANQVEFRFIISYMNDPVTIEAYRSDPTTDFHDWVSKECRIKRKPAKSVNFGMAFNAGKGNITNQLATNEDVKAEMLAVIEQEIASGATRADDRDSRYLTLCMRRASDIFDHYHQRFPKLKMTSNAAAKVARIKGYVRNLFGRRRNFKIGDKEGSRKAFNTLVQGGAMDFIKGRMVAIAPRYNSWTRAHGIRLNVNVHDGLLFRFPKGLAGDMRVHGTILQTLECLDDVPDIRVPLLWKGKRAPTRWSDAEKKENEIDRAAALAAVA